MADRTDFVIILDRSGSMNERKSDHEGGLKSFVADQRRIPGDVRLTFVKFDSANPFELVLDAIPLDQVDESKIELVPRGGTPLLDAVGMTLEHVQKKLLDRSQKPDQLVVMIITDGHENASTKYKKEQIKQMVADREKDGWKILYLGANVDEFAEANALGIDSRVSLGYVASSTGTGEMYRSLITNTSTMRTAAARGMTGLIAYSNLSFTKEQRTNAKKEDKDESVSSDTSQQANTETSV